MASFLEIILIFVVAFVVLFPLQFILPILYGLFFAKHQEVKTLIEEKWKKDVVYLFQMPGTEHIPSVSPFCLKVETFLRLHHINYERRYTVIRRGANGKVPFIEFNGEHHSDSTIIIKRLAWHFKINEYEKPEDERFGYALQCMADNHMYNLFLHYKVNHNPGRLFMGMIGGAIPELAMDILAPILAPFISAHVHLRLNGAIGSFSEEEYRELTRKDLTVIQDQLADKKYLFGDKMTTADCSVFSHMACMLALDQHAHPTYLLKSHQFVPLRDYVERVRNHLYAGKFSWQQQ